MKVEVELPPGVYPTDAEVQALLRKFQEIKAATFKFRLRKILLEHLKLSPITSVAEVQTEAAINAFCGLDPEHRSG